ncbi:hypothetical protein VNO80_01669 [Phaseolus coccineus]|uniref:Uncharacterized protein n=1 Tax=Phaseolus coccineus TaxID=3886 RepID=A0AAN9RT57_PHACN
MEVIDAGPAEEGAGNRNAESVADNENPKTPFCWSRKRGFDFGREENKIGTKQRMKGILYGKTLQTAPYHTIGKNSSVS